MNSHSPNLHGFRRPTGEVAWSRTGELHKKRLLSRRGELRRTAIGFSVDEGPSQYRITEQSICTWAWAVTLKTALRESSSLDDALGFVETLLTCPRCVVVDPGRGTGAPLSTFVASPMLAATLCLTTIWRRWPLSQGASGSPRIATMPGLFALRRRHSLQG